MFLKQIVGYVQRTETAIVRTLHMVNEYFGVGVVSEPRMASAGVEPWMGSSTDEHLPRSTICTKRICQFQQQAKYPERYAHAVPCGCRLSLNGSS